MVNAYMDVVNRIVLDHIVQVMSDFFFVDFFLLKNLNSFTSKFDLIKGHTSILH